MNLEALTKTPETQRDHQWEEQFFKALSEAEVKLVSADPVQGPDQWPYLMAETLDGPTPKTDTSVTIDSSQKIIHWLSTRGIGLVLNPRKEYPDYVFSYGMLWSFRETGYFRKLDKTLKNGQMELDFTKSSFGSPTEQYLPLYVRSILRDFFRDQGILKSKILVALNTDGHADLIFSLESLGNPKPQELDGVGEAIAWFLPPHYSVVLLSEKGLPPFFDL